MPDTLPSALPEWSLSDLYSSFDAGEMQRDQRFVEDDASDLASVWKGRLNEASAKELATVISRYEAISEKLGRMTSYTDLAFAADMSEPETGRQAQVMRELDSAIGAKLVFVELEIDPSTVLKSRGGN